MRPLRDLSSIDAEFRAAGLEPLDAFTSAGDERRCRCTRCGTTRLVRLSNLRQGGVACRWCHGWERWTGWSESARTRAARTKPLGTPADVLELLRLEHLSALTPMGDLYQPVGVVCLTCGETFVTVPVRIHAERPGWNACQRCSSDRKRALRVDAAAVFHANGLELLGPCRGEYAPQRARCMTCGVERLVSFHRLQTGSSPLCWTCTHGIRPDEPHRVYLFHFPSLNVMKVGLTHNRHDRRLFQHMAEGGELIDTIVVADRESARRLEQLLKARYESWLMAEVGPADFPQGGWTETWSDSAPVPDLAAEAAAAFSTVVSD